MEDIRKGWECELFESRINEEMDAYLNIADRDDRVMYVYVHQGYMERELNEKLNSSKINADEYGMLKKTLRAKARKVINGKA